ILGRVGGEEFAVVLPRTDASGAVNLAEELRAAAQSQDIRAKDGAQVAVTISIGVAAFDADAATIAHEAMYRRADEALYAAKHAGRNQTICVEALGAET